MVAPKNPKKKPEPVDNRVVHHDAFDDMAYEKVEDYERLKEILEAQPEDPTQKRLTEEQRGQITDLVKDAFTSFYRTEPKVIEEKESLSRDIVQQFHEMPEFKNFHATSMLDHVPSALGTIQMTPVLVQKLQEIQEEIEKQREEQREQNEQDGKDPEDGVPQGGPRLSELGAPGMSSLRQAIRQAVEKADQENEEHQGQMRSWGIGKGEVKLMDPKERLELADRMKEAGRLKDVSKLIGRFKNVVSSTLATLPSHGVEEITDVTMGSDIQRMLPVEALKLLENEELFYKDMLEGKLLQYEMKGVQHAGKGPMIACFDISGSMGGSREAWAKAVVLALMNYSQDQKRAFGWIAFESEVNESRFFPKGEEIAFAEKVHVAEISTTGGTDFQCALQEAMDLHAKEPQAKPADIVFITDGECRVPDDFLEEFNTWKKKHDVRVFGIGISDSSHHETAEFETMEEFCDQLCMVNSLGEITALRQAVQMVHKQKEVKS